MFSVLSMHFGEYIVITTDTNASCKYKKFLRSFSFFLFQLTFDQKPAFAFWVGESLQTHAHTNIKYVENDN